MGRTPVLTLLLTLLLAAPAAAQSSNARYELVRGCYGLQSGGKFVARGPSGFALTAPSVGAAEPFRMQATALGRYALYGRARDFMTGSDSGVAPESQPGDGSDWQVDGNGPQFTLTLPASGKSLGVGPGGRLVLVDRAAATPFAFERAEGCPQYPEVEINATGESPKGPTPWGEVSGLVDAHMHHMGFEFLGGGAHCGKPWDRFGAPYALADCPDHASGFAPLDTALGGNARHDPVGWPTFKDWPAWNSLTHEQSYYRWIERAWRGGLRTFVNLFVDNKALCDVYPIKKHGCNEMDTVRLEIKDIYALQDYIDAQAGGPGKGFYRIVKTPFEARKVINDGKLAVVLGIEVSQLFDCNVYNDVPTCDEAQINRQLQEVYDAGVRDMELINKFDNAFGGVAGDEGETGVVVNQGNKKETGRYWQLQHCEGDAHDRSQLSPSSHNTDALIGNGLQMFLPPGATPVYPSPPQCNVRGLSRLGEYLVTKMMDKGMIIDPDHLSVLARRQVLDLLEARRYSGAVSSHSWSTPDAYPRIYKVGGFIAPYAGASTTFVQQWRQRKKERDDRFYWGMGYGADMNGFGAQGPPRPDAAKNPVTYPFKSYDGAVTFDRQRSGERVYDINKDGVAQYGLYPDWIEDLRKIAGDEIVKDMGRGSEAYLEMWERAEGVPNRRCQPARTRFKPDRFGLLRLGLSSEALLRAAGQPFTRGPRTWRWCVPGRTTLPDGDAISVLSPEGVTALVGSTGAESSALGVGRGDRARRLRAKGAKRLGATMRIKRLKGGTAFVWGVRSGRVRWVALASRDVAARRGQLRSYLKLAGLR